MFKLQRLEITGFKSFADYTQVIFTDDGITAVVGPNGCGKSNVSESIAWVLGEQRAKQLRGEEMKDVIFQGTSKRQPSGMAEVVLHLVRDNSTFDFEEEELGDIDEALGEIDERSVTLDSLESTHIGEPENAVAQTFQSNGNGFHSHSSEGGAAVARQPIQVGHAETKIKTKRHWKPRQIALDFAPGEAVTVARRLYRSGESEYILNGKPCRLRDIHDLFAGTGLSGAHYAIIEQGRIGQILSAKPSDRRTLIEEAAGISKFRTRQRAAEARLEGAKTNLSRITDIVDEIDKHANSLRRQAAKTRRFSTLRENLREMQRNLFAAEGAYLNELSESLGKKLTEAVSNEKKIADEVTLTEAEFKKATQDARLAEEALAEVRAQHAENALQRDRAVRDLEYKKEQQESFQARANSLSLEIKTIEDRVEVARREFEALEIDERNERAIAEKEQQELSTAEVSFQTMVSVLKSLEHQIEENRNQLMQQSAAVERFDEVASHLEQTIERLTERLEGLDREAKRADEVHQEHVAESAKHENLLVEARTKREKLQQQNIALAAVLEEARNSLQNAEKAFADSREEFSKANHRRETLRELDDRREIYAPAVQTLFAEQEKIGVHLLGTLADKLKVTPGFERAIESVFGSHLETILVSSIEHARRLSRHLETNNLGRAAMLVVADGESVFDENRTPAAREGNSIVNHLGISDAFARLIEKVFPRQASAKLVENFESAEVSDGEVFVNESGEMLIGGNLFIGGKARTNEKGFSLLAFKRELRDLEESTKHSLSAIETRESAAQSLRTNLLGQERQIGELQGLLQVAEREILSQEIHAKALTQEIERAERHKKVVEDERTQISKELAEVRSKQKESKESALKAETAKTELSAALLRIGGELSFARGNVETENASLNEKSTRAATAVERSRAAKNALDRLGLESKELETRLQRYHHELRSNEESLAEIATAISGLKVTIESTADEKLREQEELNESVAKVQSARKNADELSGVLGELNKRSAEARDSRGEIEISKAETKTRLSNLDEHCLQELSHSLIELMNTVELPEGFDLETTRTEVDELRRRLENFGAVNMLAVEELTEAEERLLFLTSQRKDIVDSIEATEEALREIKKRSREKFRQAFLAINEYFSEFFRELFGGGNGEMSLLEAEDILDSGIEIVAQPPGKRLQSILLLSGGEKAMTAIALVMAIFKYRPSPFCLLDEVDAPLDDANVGRFVDKIAQMSENTQFIVITHNKRTMEAARALYGVTMEEPGVSKVVSVKFA